MQIIAMQITVMPVAIKKIIFIAKVGSKTLPKSEVCAIDWHIKTSKPRLRRGLLVAELAAEKGIICCPRCPKKWNASNAMKSINN